jgi:2-polyprenyl-6-methoxyphenol hydroxylase-like FAD-dependent oxidoreductase
MKNLNVLISGASVAGPALAYWLKRYGCTPTVVERAPAVRPGGYAVDFRGAALEALVRMGLLEKVCAHATNMGDITYVGEGGRRVARVPSVALSGELEILRGDLVDILYAHTRDDVEYLFDDSIASIVDGPDGARVTFEKAPPRTFDLVIGADGLHSNVRRLVFGEESAYSHDLGLYASVFTTPNHLGLDHTGQFYNVPGKVAGMYSARHNTEAKALLYWASEPLDYDRRDVEQQQKLLRDAYAGVGWEVPRILEGLAAAPDFYFDSVTQIKMPQVHKGRVTLVGDAGYCASPLSGMGTSLALVGAYVLAGELRAAGGDHRVAFARYEEELRPYIEACHKQGTGGVTWFVPKTKAWLRFRNLNLRLMALLPGDGIAAKIALKAANAIKLKQY